jgi:hypothetical protein
MNSNGRPNGQGGGGRGAGQGYNRRQVYPPAAQNVRSQAVSMKNRVEFRYWLIGWGS